MVALTIQSLPVRTGGSVPSDASRVSSRQSASKHAARAVPSYRRQALIRVTVSSAGSALLAWLKPARASPASSQVFRTKSSVTTPSSAHPDGRGVGVQPVLGDAKALQA